MAEEPSTYLVWDLEVPGLGEVWLRGEDAGGYPTQTWLNGELLEREPEGKFAWAVEAGVPLPVYVMDRTAVMYPGQPDMACYFVRGEVELWDKFAGDSTYSDPFRARCAAYAHYGRALLERIGCS